MYIRDHFFKICVFFLFFNKSQQHMQKSTDRSPMKRGTRLKRLWRQILIQKWSRVCKGLYLVLKPCRGVCECVVEVLNLPKKHISLIFSEKSETYLLHNFLKLFIRWFFVIDSYQRIMNKWLDGSKGIIIKICSNVHSIDLIIIPLDTGIVSNLFVWSNKRLKVYGCKHSRRIAPQYVVEFFLTCSACSSSIRS